MMADQLLFLSLRGIDMLKSIRREPVISFVILVLLCVMGVLIYYINIMEDERGIAVDHVLDNCKSGNFVAIVDGFVLPVYDCSEFAGE